jgi:DNA polymerase-3 subunit delta'
MAVTPLPWLQAPLAEALRQQRAHAILVHGPSGVGQFDFGLALAQAWLCEAVTPQGACGHCTGCHWMASRTHPDFRLLMPDAVREALGWGGEAAAESESKTKAKPSREIKVETVREAIAWSHSTASRGRGKVVLIHPAQAMNAVAANALLKTLEEPPAGVRLLLCCAEPEALLPTIRSRCQRWRLDLPSRADSLQWLQAQGVADAAVLLAASSGRPLDAAALAADGVQAAQWRALPVAVRRGDARPLAGWPVPRVVDALQKLCHDAMAVCVGAEPRYFPADALSGNADLQQLAAWSKTLSRAARHDEHPWNAPLLAESLVLDGAKAWAPAAPQRVATLTGR